METRQWRFITVFWRFLLLLFFLLAMPGRAFSNSSNNAGNQKLVKTAEKYIGVREQGHNRGEQIEKWQRQFGGRPGEPYCAYFVSAMLEESGSVLPTVRSGWSRSFYDKKSIRINHILKGYAKAEPGWILVWANFKNGKMQRSGHVGINVRQISGREIKFETIEANTRSGEKGNQADGDGVYRRIRKINTSGSFRLIGISISK